MAASKLPKFGAWEGEETYTVYFDNARKKKSDGQNINPNDPEDNPEMFQHNGGPGQAPQADAKGRKTTKVDQNDHQLRNASRGSNSSETASRYGKQNPRGQSPLHQKGANFQQRPPAGRGSQTQEKGAVIPAWGVWKTDPQQAKGFTGAFMRAKEERNTPLNANIPPRYSQQPSKQEPKGCCFGWF